MRWVFSAFADEASEMIDEQVRALREAGMRHVDLRMVDGTNIVELPLAEAEAVKRKLDAAGIAVCMYGSPIGKITLDDDLAIDERRLRHLGALKGIFGARMVRLFSYYNKGGLPRAMWREAAVDRLRRLIDIADEFDLVLYHENEIGIYGGPGDHVRDLRDAVWGERPDRFKLIFDFDNYNQNGEDIWANYVELREATGALHLKESRRQADGTYQHVPAGEGDGQMPRVLADLASRGWDGPLTLEPHLARSAAVLATGPHGQANRSLADLSPYECFQLAAEAAKKLLADVKRL